MEDKGKRKIYKLAETKYFKWGATIFCVGALLVLFYRMVSYFPGFKSGLGTVKTILSPFIYGFVMAYLLSPVYNFVVRKLYPILSKKVEKRKNALTISKSIATVISLLVLIGVVSGMLALLIPQVVESVRILTATLPERFDQLNNWMDGILANFENQEIAEKINHAFGEMQDNLLAWLQDTFLPGVGSFMQRISNGLIVTIKTVLNMVIGVIACAYFLNGKEIFRAQFKKVSMAIFPEKRANEIYDFFAYTNKTFGGFITGKLIDSVIIGMLCFIAMKIIGLPYPILISTIIGVTNIIPFFGPFIGAIPSLAIIFIVSPVQALYFLILVIVLQQLDGNVIGPAILGNSIGIASFWVMFAIIVGGGLFGFPGMVLGVPIFAVIYYYMSKLVARRLDDKGMKEWTKDYIDYGQYGIPNEEILNEEYPEEAVIKEADPEETQEAIEEVSQETIEEAIEE